MIGEILLKHINGSEVYYVELVAPQDIRIQRNISGLRGAFLGTHTGTPFVISMITMVIGLMICFYEAYIRKK